MKDEFKPSLLDKAICGLSPERGMRRLAAKRVLHEYRYDGAASTSKRGSAPHNISPNSFDVQRDRLQLMREAEDMERNFAPAMMLNRKVAMYCSPISYHAQTGDPGLSKEVEEYLNYEAFQNCDITQRYDFFRMMEFGLMGCNRGGDYGWAFMRPGLEEGMSEEDALQLPLRLQAVEPDRIGGIYQNVVSNDYVSGCIIGKYGEIEAFRVFHRSMTTNVYDNPVDIPAKDFVHLTDPMRIDQYRGVSVLATAIQNLRDLYEMIDFVKGKAKIASALTVFTNSNGAMAGNGAMDAYATNLFPGGSSGLQQDIAFGQINHLAGGTDIKFPASNSPSSEEQALMTLLLKFVAMSYKLPYSFALDAAALGGVSSRLESEMAKAEFERVQRVLAPHATRIKNMFLYDAVAKGIFKAKDYQRIIKGRWGYRSHPQPDLGREAAAAVNLFQTGLLNPIKYWIDNAEDPEDVASDMVRWAEIKRSAAEAKGFEVQDVFGAGMAKPVSQTESVTESTTTDATTETSNESKAFSTRHNFRESDASIAQRIKDTQAELDELQTKKDKFTSDLNSLVNEGGSPALINRSRVAIDRINAEINDVSNDLAQLKEREWRRANNKKPVSEPTPEQQEAKAIKARKRDDRHALSEALKMQGYPDAEAYAIAYDIIESGKFNKSKLPAEIQKKYYP